MTLYVLTGGPCCGKTSVLRELKRKGYETLDEVARDLLERRAVKPKTYDEWLEFEKEIVRAQNRQEKDVINYRDPKAPCILDRSLIDAIAYTKYHLHTVPKKFTVFNVRIRYTAVFLLDRLPLEIDGRRTELTDAEAQEKHDMIIETYKEYGYEPIRISVSDIRIRANQIENKILELEGEKHGRMLYTV